MILLECSIEKCLLLYLFALLFFFLLWDLCLKAKMTKIRIFHFLLKFIYSEKATKFCEIFTLLLTTVHIVKSKVKILQNFVAFSEYMNFTKSSIHIISKLNEDFSEDFFEVITDLTQFDVCLLTA